MSDAPEIWVGLCQFKDENQQDGEVLAGAWTNDRGQFDQIVGAYMRKRHRIFIFSELVMPAHRFLTRHSHPDLHTVANRVGPHNLATLGTVSLKSVVEEPQDYLKIEEIEGVEPLDAQFGIHPKKTVPDALYEPLFGQPEPTEDEIKAADGDAAKVSPMKLYAILEAGKMVNFPEMLGVSGLDYKCLFKGEAYDELKDVAPYIVELTEDNDFTRKLFTKSNAPWDMWDKELGIYIRSRASLDELWRHFRKFTRIQDENGKWFYFRFWDVSNQSRKIFGNERFIKLFYSHSCLFYTAKGAGSYCIFLNKNFSESELRKPIVITAHMKNDLFVEHQSKYVRDILHKNHPELARTLNKNLQEELSINIAKRILYYKLIKKYSKNVYINASLLFGIQFDEDVAYSDAHTILNSSDPCYLRMTDLKANFFKPQFQIYGEKCQNYLKALNRIATLEYSQFLSLSQKDNAEDRFFQFFPEKTVSLSVSQQLTLCGFSRQKSQEYFSPEEMYTGEILILLHVLVLGTSCLNDPLYDYVRKILQTDEENKAERLFLYSQKRAKKQIHILTKKV